MLREEMHNEGGGREREKKEETGRDGGSRGQTMLQRMLGGAGKR